MFAPKVAKTQTKALADLANGSARERLNLAAHGHSGVEQALLLQRTIGNQGTLQLLEKRSAAARDHNIGRAPLNTAATARQRPTGPPPTLRVGAADDPLEFEADRIAEQVMRMAHPDPRDASPRVTNAVPSLRRACAECEAAERDDEATPVIRRRAAEIDAGAGLAPQSVHHVLTAEGQPLPGSVREFFEPRFGADLGHVRVHADAAAAASAREVGAHAYAVGPHIVFARDRYAPGSLEGDRLVAHELSHVLQQGPPRLRRRAGDDNPLTGISAVLIRTQPPTFRVTLAFEKAPVSFEANLIGHISVVGSQWEQGTQRISAEPWPEEVAVQSGAVLFNLLDQQDPNIWFKVDENAKADLIRARAFLLEHDPVTLTIAAATKAEASDAGQRGDEKPQEPRFVDAEDWLKKQMLPSVEMILAQKYPDVKPSRLVGYQSLPIQAKEGSDVSMIQVERGVGAARQIAGHLRVYRSKWAGQSSDAKATYASATAEAIVRVLAEALRKQQLHELDKSLKEEDKTKTAFPAWAIALRTQVENKLAAIRAAVPTGADVPKDLPDATHLAWLGEDVRLRLFVGQPAANAPDKLVLNSGLMSPALSEDQQKDIDAVVRSVREQTALLRGLKIELVDKTDAPALTNILMPAIPATISAPGMNLNGTSITGATNGFYMSVRTDLVFSTGGGPNALKFMTIHNGLGLSEVDYTWKVVRLTFDSAAKFLRQPAQPAAGKPGTAAGDVIAELSNPSIDQPTKVALANQLVDVGAAMDNAWPIADVDHGDFSYMFPSEEGVYLVVCSVTPRPLIENTSRQVFPPSRAAFPARIVTREHLGAEAVSQDPNAIAEKERAKADPALTDTQRLEIQRDIDRLHGEEKLSQLELTRQAQKDVEEKIARFTALKSWLLADRAQHATVLGTAAEDPLVVRMLTYDKVHDTNLFRSFKELVGMYGEAAYEINWLAQPFTTADGQIHVLNRYLALLDSQRTQAAQLAGTIAAEQQHFLNGQARRTVATLVVAKTGKAIPLLLLVGEAPESAPGGYKYRIMDLTLSATPLFKRKDQIYVGDTFHSPDVALYSAFIRYGEDNEYDEGTVFYRFADESDLRSVPNVKTATEYAEQAAVVLALIGAIASVAVSGGATTPAVAAVVAWISVASAALTIGLAAEHLWRRHEAGTLEMDSDMAFDVINIIASAVGLGAAAKSAQLGRAAQAAGSAARAAQALAQIERIGTMMLIFDATVLGASAVVTAIKVSDDVAAIKNLHLPPAQEDALLKQVASDAVMQGAMLAFQSVLLARSHLDTLREKLGKTGYKSLEERGWVDAEGRVTKTAPPTLRAGAKGAPPPYVERPPVDLEAELPAIRQAVEEGAIGYETTDPDHDISIPFKDRAGEDHSLKRRREDGVWCRYSSDPFCYIDPKILQEIAGSIGLGKIPILGRTPGPATRRTVGGIEVIERPLYRLNDFDLRTTNKGLIWSIEKGPDPLGLYRVTITGELGPSIPRDRSLNLNRSDKLIKPEGPGINSADWEMLHLVGAGFGDEAGAGLMPGPKEMNQLFQNQGVEGWMRVLGRQARAADPNARVLYRATAVPWAFPTPSGWRPTSGAEMLHYVEYQVRLEIPGLPPQPIRVAIETAPPPSARVQTIEIFPAVAATPADLLAGLRRK